MAKTLPHPAGSPHQSSAFSPNNSNGAAASMIPATKPKPPMFVMKDDQGKRIRHGDVTQEEGQRQLDAYFQTHGQWPSSFRNGVFKASKKMRDAANGASPAPAPAANGTGPAPAAAAKSLVGSTQQISPTPSAGSQKRKHSLVGKDDSLAPSPKKSKDVSPASSPQQNIKESFVPAASAYLSEDEESSGDEKQATNGNHLENRSQITKSLPAPRPATAQQFTAFVIPDFETDLPLIPDIKKSWYQLEQESLYGGVRPDHFPRHLWNKPIPTEWPGVEEDSSESEEDEGDAREERKKQDKRVKERKAYEKAEGIRGLWKPKTARWYHAEGMRLYYRARYPNVDPGLIEKKIAKEYPITHEEEKRCTALARENEKVVEAHNAKVMADHAAKKAAGLLPKPDEEPPVGSKGRGRHQRRDRAFKSQFDPEGNFKADWENMKLD